MTATGMASGPASASASAGASSNVSNTSHAKQDSLDMLVNVHGLSNVLEVLSSALPLGPGPGPGRALPSPSQDALSARPRVNPPPSDARSTLTPSYASAHALSPLSSAVGVASAAKALAMIATGAPLSPPTAAARANEHDLTETPMVMPALQLPPTSTAAIGPAQNTPFVQRQSVPFAQRFGTPPTPSSSPVSDAGADGFNSAAAANGSNGFVATPFIGDGMASITVPTLDSDDDANSSSSSGAGSDRDADADADGHVSGSSGNSTDSTNSTDITDSTDECSSNGRTRCFVEASCGGEVVEPRPSKKQRTHPTDEAHLNPDAAATGANSAYAGSMVDNDNNTGAATRGMRGIRHL